MRLMVRVPYLVEWAPGCYMLKMRWALPRCPREQMGYNCHIWPNGYCEGCERGVKKATVTTKEG